MSSFYTGDQLKELAEKRENARKRYYDISEKCLLRAYKSERAQEFATHGFCRRLGMLHQAIEQVFLALPPEMDNPPEEDRIETATIALQSFVINTSGSLDNLAWVWVLEKNIRQRNGREISPLQVGFGPNHGDVLNSLPEELRLYVLSRSDWVEGLKGFRDSLAHRIPLYIPPYQVQEKDVAEFRRLDDEAHAALLRRNLIEEERLRHQQTHLKIFRPIMLHSLSEGWIPFHVQMLVDFLTVDEYSTEVFKHLDR